MQCQECGELANIKSEPPRHLTSPNSINRFAKDEEDKIYLWYCSRECQKKNQREAYIFWAELDRNASDSECFIHDHWETDRLKRKIRVGRCNITGEEVKVEPLQPGDNSGQPIACYNHFKLKSVYK